jgi:hypothetical protein
MEWNSDAGIFSIDAFNADFSIVMDSPYGLGRGTLFLEVRDGLVARSHDSGAFDGLLPALGSLGSFSLPLGSLNVDYDLGDLDRFGSRNLQLDFGFHTDGEALAALMPEPGSGLLLMLGLGLLPVMRRTPRSQRRVVAVADCATTPR